VSHDFNWFFNQNYSCSYLCEQNQIFFGFEHDLLYSFDMTQFIDPSAILLDNDDWWSYIFISLICFRVSDSIGVRHMDMFDYINSEYQWSLGTPDWKSNCIFSRVATLKKEKWSSRYHRHCWCRQQNMMKRHTNIDRSTNQIKQAVQYSYIFCAVLSFLSLSLSLPHPHSHSLIFIWKTQKIQKQISNDRQRRIKTKSKPAAWHERNCP
jgi:hypothetical protein